MAYFQINHSLLPPPRLVENTNSITINHRELVLSRYLLYKNSLEVAQMLD